MNQTSWIPAFARMTKKGGLLHYKRKLITQFLLCVWPSVSSVPNFLIFHT